MITSISYRDLKPPSPPPALSSRVIGRWVVVEGTEMKYYLNAAKQSDGFAPLTTLKLTGCSAKLFMDDDGEAMEACFVLQTADGKI